MASAPTLALTLKNILFATDFTASSEAALPYARALARRYGSTIHLIHVVAAEPHVAAVPLEKLPLEFDKPWHTAHEQMTRFLASDPLQEIPFDAVVERGPVWDVIEEQIEQRKADLIVVGTHGHRGIKRLVLGSVAEEIFRRAECPVLTIGPEAPHNGTVQADFTKILFATDFSSGSSHALPYALSLAAANQAQLTLLHVVQEVSESVVEYLDQVAAVCRKQLTEMLPANTGLSHEPELFVEFGPAADTILKVAEEQQAKLIVMGARRGGAVTAHMPWPVAHRVVCHAHCPVLTVRS